MAGLKGELRDRRILATVLVSALGYFVDIYDLLLFGIVRIPSLKSLGVSEDQLLSKGLLLLNMQMAGMLVGGVLWGILGDKRGRKSVLFGSILMYSLANIANAFVPNVEIYCALRFIAGVGLAGELGAAITLVSEVMSKESRGIGTTLVATVGILGAVVGSMVGDTFSWQTAYLVGGFMGLGLLLLRASLLESGMFESMVAESNVKKGSFLDLFTSRERFFKYMACILIGVPIWFVVGTLITFAPEFSQQLGVVGLVTASKAIMWSYVGLSLGDLSSGLVSQVLKSRKKSVSVFLVLTAVLTFTYVLQSGWSAEAFYVLCFLLGVSTGYWAVFVTIAAEQFGTNIRATVTTTVPNFVRGSVVPVTLAFGYFRGHIGMIPSVTVVGAVVFALAGLSLWKMKETFGKDLNYFE
ncbi:MAG: MFS transporter [Bdellovibrionaceae bacterium]|nr:MFS transporter [Pseudobdellovibrionaceae bacterium]|tara:strand:+ start:651 stop:1883 length:1233 start_codon:yes stop_codon:yes gene_type:complete